MSNLLGRVVVTVLCLSMCIVGSVKYELADFVKSSANAGFGIVNVEGDSYIAGTINPNFSIMALDLGVDINLFMPVGSKTNDRPKDFQSIVLRKVRYNHENKFGFQYGHLQNVTLGQGLLMDNYDSMAGGTTIFSNDKAGLLGYLTLFGYKLTGMTTGSFSKENESSKIEALRLSKTLPFQLLKAPVTVGATYVKDTRGINTDTVSRRKQRGYAADLSAPIGGDFLVLFLEGAKLEDQGQGLSGGFHGAVPGVFRYKAEIRSLEKGFVPSYFNNSYEAQSFNFDTDALTEASSGLVFGMGSDFLQGMFKADAQYELYDDKNLFTAALGWSSVLKTTGVINYSLPFQGSNSRTLSATMLYKSGGLMNYVINLKRIYTDDSVVETYSAGAQLNLNALVPGLPF